MRASGKALLAGGTWVRRQVVFSSGKRLGLGDEYARDARQLEALFIGLILGREVAFSCCCLRPA